MLTDGFNIVIAPLRLSLSIPGIKPWIKPCTPALPSLLLSWLPLRVGPSLNFSQGFASVPFVKYPPRNDLHPRDTFR